MRPKRASAPLKNRITGGDGFRWFSSQMPGGHLLTYYFPTNQIVALQVRKRETEATQGVWPTTL